MFIVKSNIENDNSLDASVKLEHRKINKFLTNMLIILNLFSFIATLALAIKFYQCRYNMTFFLFLIMQTCLWTYWSILNIYDQKYVSSIFTFFGLNLYRECYANYNNLFLTDEIQEYHFMSIALSHLPFLYICYDIVVFQSDSSFVKSTLDSTTFDQSLIFLSFARGVFCSLSIALIFIVWVILNVQNTFRTCPLMKILNLKTRKYLWSIFFYYLIDSQIRIVTFLFIVETYDVNPFKIFVFIFSQILTVCICIAFDTHIFKNIIIGLSSILVSPLSIILHSADRNFGNERVIRFSKLLMNFRFFEFFLILFYGTLYYDEDEVGNAFTVYTQLIYLILLFLLIMIYKRVLVCKTIFEDANADECAVDLYNNISEN